MVYIDDTEKRGNDKPRDAISENGCRGWALNRENIAAARTKFDMDLCELNEILEELGELPTTFSELERAGIVLTDSPRPAFSLTERILAGKLVL